MPSAATVRSQVPTMALRCSLTEGYDWLARCCQVEDLAEEVGGGGDGAGGAGVVTDCAATAGGGTSPAELNGALPKVRAFATVMSTPHCCAISAAAVTHAW